MAIVHDANSVDNDGSEVSPIAWNHTMATGVGRIIMMVGSAWGNAAGVWGAVSFGGEPATAILASNWDNTAPDRECLLVAYLVNPPTGVNVVSIAAPWGTYCGGAVSYTGVDPNNPIGDFQVLTRYGVGVANIEHTLTSRDGELAFFALAIMDENDPTPGAPGAGTTRRASEWSISGVGTAENAMTTGEEDGAASVTVGFTGLRAAGGSYKSAFSCILRPFIEFSGRPIEYAVDIWDPAQNIIDSSGIIVPRYKIKPNNWIRTIGLDSPTAEVYENNYDDPTLAYIEHVSYDGENDQVEVITNRGDLPEVILARLGAGAT